MRVLFGAASPANLQPQHVHQQASFPAAPDNSSVESAQIRHHHEKAFAGEFVRLDLVVERFDARAIRKEE